MQKSFMADIHVNVSTNSKNIVSIIPFSDSDKPIAKIIEKVLNNSLAYDDDIEFGLEGLKRLANDSFVHKFK